MSLLLSPPALAMEIEFTFYERGIWLLPLTYFLMGSAGREFLEKSEHFSHPTVDLLTLLKMAFSNLFILLVCAAM
ncbi:hypothetical protein Tco_0526918 [Tanacetum coccineum]